MTTLEAYRIMTIGFPTLDISLVSFDECMKHTSKEEIDYFIKEFKTSVNGVK